MKNVIIKITGTQGIDGDENIIELTTVGTLLKQNDEIILSYKEGEMIGAKNVKTVLHAKGQESVIMERSGELASRLVIKKGSRNNCFYSTPQGDLVIGIFGESIKNSLTASGGTLEMSYTIDSNLQPISKNKVKITVREEN